MVSMHLECLKWLKKWLFVDKWARPLATAVRFCPGALQGAPEVLSPRRAAPARGRASRVKSARRAGFDSALAGAGEERKLGLKGNLGEGYPFGGSQIFMHSNMAVRLNTEYPFCDIELFEDHSQMCHRPLTRSSRSSH